MALWIWIMNFGALIAASQQLFIDIVTASWFIIIVNVA